MFPAEDDERFPDTNKNIINSVNLLYRKEKFHWVRLARKLNKAQSYGEIGLQAVKSTQELK